MRFRIQIEIRKLECIYPFRKAKSKKKGTGIRDKRKVLHRLYDVIMNRSIR